LLTATLAEIFPAAVLSSAYAHKNNYGRRYAIRAFGGSRFFHHQSGGEVMAISLNVNGKAQQVDVPAEMPLLWVLRDTLGLTGTKFGCGMAQCGACTVHVNGMAMRSCALPVGSVSGPVVTIEGLSKNGDHPLQKAWVKNNVPQCGYCQAGQIMQAAALLKSTPKPSDADIDGAMSGNICRCGTYTRIRAAIKEAAGVRS
jgi:aerobic-type carbon monoxide dehydrogenase small subunit (CoxS/CutS family)